VLLLEDAADLAALDRDALLVQLPLEQVEGPVAGRWHLTRFGLGWQATRFGDDPAAVLFVVGGRSA
jgi:hypothetical protein